MQGVTNTATPARWEDAFKQWMTGSNPGWHVRADTFKAGWDAAIASQAHEIAQLRTKLSVRDNILSRAHELDREVSGLRAQLASQAELVAAALAWYDDDITSVARRRADTALSKAVEAYRSARSA